MELANVLHMTGGIGDSSYARNSHFQQKVILMTKSITDEAISALYRSLSNGETICIAELGCSSGPNTFLPVSQLIKTIREECTSNGQQLPEFHVFLNDLPGNDFNTIFRLLPRFHEDLKKQNMRSGDGLFDPSYCFVAGVAGSFYTRLFPSKKLHFVHSAYSLHWLSQVPDGIENNKGTIYAASTSPSSVLKAYSKQYERDFATFLKYRSEELVKGGHMVLTMPGRENEHHLSNVCRFLLEPLAIALKDLVTEESIEEEKVDSFNVPVYCPSPAEIKYIVEKEGSFTIDLLKTLEHQMDSCEGYNEAESVRAFAQPLLVRHFGDDNKLMDVVFNKCRDIYANIMAKEKNIFTNVVVSLIKF
ncbi:hypothetical protein R3W88_002094 [Solanum pinnatisectum]|uniref:Uncharacterized protein n=1 Tax=Solanum pinnatisectum TaxID=50273 RepID=A0AAV9MK29_9SOLN|nr:hypothetical protein R3W88_002094 [Solanum pinnatisectum]